LKLPAWLSTWLIHVDAHELHHMYPFVPAYRLKEIAYPTENEIGFLEWLKGAKRLRGEVFLFQNRLESGAPI
jgi:fatty acid desaturase